MADDPFASHSIGLSSPATKHYTVVLDSPGPTELDPRPRKLIATSDGNVEIIDEAGTAITYPVTSGQVLDFRPVSLGDGTTASLVAWL